MPAPSRMLHDGGAQLSAALSASLPDGVFADTKLFAYSARAKAQPGVACKPRAIYANSAVLKAASPYFQGLLSRPTDVDVPETAPYADADEDSDLEDDEDDENKPDAASIAFSASTHSTATKVPEDHVVYIAVIRDVAPTTLRALINYLYTDRLEFAQIKSCRAQRHHTRDTKVCSPKSMYGLATQLGLSALRWSAEAEIRRQLTPTNVLEELFSPFTARHPEILRIEVEYFHRNCVHPGSADDVQAQFERIACGELPHAVPAMMALFNMWTSDSRIAQARTQDSTRPPLPAGYSYAYPSAWPVCPPEPYPSWNARMPPPLVPGSQYYVPPSSLHGPTSTRPVSPWFQARPLSRSLVNAMSSPTHPPAAAQPWAAAASPVLSSPPPPAHSPRPLSTITSVSDRSVHKPPATVVSPLQPRWAPRMAMPPAHPPPPRSRESAPAAPPPNPWQTRPPRRAGPTGTPRCPGPRGEMVPSVPSPHWPGTFSHWGYPGGAETPRTPLSAEPMPPPLPPCGHAEPMSPPPPPLSDSQTYAPAPSERSWDALSPGSTARSELLRARTP